MGSIQSLLYVDPISTNSCVGQFRYVIMRHESSVPSVHVPPVVGIPKVLSTIHDDPPETLTCFI